MLIKRTSHEKYKTTVTSSAETTELQNTEGAMNRTEGK